MAVFHRQARMRACRCFNGAHARTHTLISVVIIAIAATTATTATLTPAFGILPRPFGMQVLAKKCFGWALKVQHLTFLPFLVRG